MRSAQNHFRNDTVHWLRSLVTADTTYGKLSFRRAQNLIQIFFFKLSSAQRNTRNVYITASAHLGMYLNTHLNILD